MNTSSFVSSLTFFENISAAPISPRVKLLKTIFFLSIYFFSTRNEKLRNKNYLTNTRRCAFVSALKWTKKNNSIFYYHTSFECNNNRQGMPRPNERSNTKSSERRRRKKIKRLKSGRNKIIINKCFFYFDIWNEQ